jgi:Aspartyl/Asparaginyl beta-hydroxylase
MVMVVSIIIRSSCLVLCWAAIQPSLGPTRVESFSCVQESIRTQRRERNAFRDADTNAHASLLFATTGGNGFGTRRTDTGSSSSKKKNPKIRQTKVKRGNDGGSKPQLQPEPSVFSSSTAEDAAAPSNNKNRPYVKAEHDIWLDQLAAQTSHTALGRIVAEYNVNRDPFWDLIPALITSKFPHANDDSNDLSRIAGFVQHALNPTDRPSDWVDQPYRPYDELHAYMPNLLLPAQPPPVPFIDPTRLSFCQDFEDHYDIIRHEYQALQNHSRDLFQSVTSMNYQSGWQTLVLFYNGHRIPQFPYHLCPTTTRLLETLPLAGRIAGFNRQLPRTGIPSHTDGNNLWLTCQMGIDVPPNEQSYIEVAGERRFYHNGQCIVYDTTFVHETYNADPQRERIVLHVDFFNTLSLTPVEIQVLQYIYKLREDFMKAEGVANVGAQIL